MPTRWGKPTDDEKWEAEMRRKQRAAVLLIIRRVVVSVVALAAVGGALVWLLDVFNRSFGDCFDYYGELVYTRESCVAYDSPNLFVWLAAGGCVIGGLFVILLIVSLIATPVTNRTRLNCACTDTCEHAALARQSAFSMGLALGIIFGTNNN